jgi:predicted glycoside hydrolase/deacetylase ChbG (UPF0249 family)
MLIVNADDWGRSVAETDAALECYRERRISSASAMLYMRDSARAAKLAADNAINIGLHLNFSEHFTDSSCPEELRQCQVALVKFLKGNKYSQLLYNPFLANAFAQSFRAQWNEFVRLYGKSPSHIDGHHHMHLCANVLFSRLIPRRMKVRRNFSFWPGEKSWLNRSYRRLVDRRLSHRYRLTDYFFDLTQCMNNGDLNRVVELAQSRYVELMIHPINPREAEYLMSDEFCEVLQCLELRTHALT